MHIAMLGGAYCAIVFLVGFLLGTVRVIWLEPAMGARYAELAEMPLMIAASYLSARLLLLRTRRTLSRAEAAWMGVVALSLLLLFELTVVLAIRGLSVADYVGTRDSVSGTAHLVSLMLFTLMPILVASRAWRWGVRA